MKLAGYKDTPHPGPLATVVGRGDSFESGFKIPLSLYIHFPWCVRKCPYCDFNSHALRGEIPEDEYVAALLRDLDLELCQFPERRPLVSIFMGGGTPSLFSGRAIARVLEGVSRRLSFAGDVEITLEANPGTAEAENFRGYRAAGVNRLSMGIQSLNDAHLKRLGRVHSSDEARRAYLLARGAGFGNINLDLMFALPQQTPAEAEADMRGLIALQPEHISYYQLTLEPNTEFARRPPPLPDQDSAWAMQESGQQMLAQGGYGQYEVSAYARSAALSPPTAAGYQSRHNRNYWEFGDYLGIGAGAHGKRTAGSEIRRVAKHKHPRTYLDGAGSAAGVQEIRAVSDAELPFEYAMNALRLREGFALADFERHTGRPVTLLDAGLAQARSQALVNEDNGRIRASETGWRFLNRLLQLFL